jgi:hypothetical protein
LLEALVAMAIIGASFGAILQMQSNLVRSLRTVENAHVEAAWRANLVEVAASIEDPLHRTGQLSFPTGEKIEWRSKDDGRSLTSPSRLGLRTRGGWTVELGPVEFVVTKEQELVLRTETFATTATRPEP